MAIKSTHEGIAACVVSEGDAVHLMPLEVVKDSK